MKIEVFISSNQSEFAEERKFLADNIRNDSSFDSYFDVYIFEEDNAKSLPSDKIFTSKVEQADIYIGLIGNNYGYEMLMVFLQPNLNLLNSMLKIQIHIFLLRWMIMLMINQRNFLII